MLARDGDHTIRQNPPDFTGTAAVHGGCTGGMNNFEEVPLDQLLYTVEDVCKLLAVKRTTVFKWLKDGTLPSIKFGAARRIHRDTLMAFAEKGTV